MSAKFFDIFSKKKVKEKPKLKIIVDYREKNSLVSSVLVNLGIEVEFQNLKVGDYIVNGVAVERKTVSDFIGSMINKRLSNQLEELLGWDACKGPKYLQNVSVPEWIKTKKEYYTSCLRGLIETDGSIYSDRGYKMVNFVRVK